MKIKRIVYMFLLLFAFWGQSLARKATIKITNLTIGAGGDSVQVDFLISAASLPPDYRMDLTPVLYNASNRLCLDPVRISGRRHQRLQERERLFDEKTVNEEDAQEAKLLYDVSATDTVHYRTSLPYEPWMDVVSLRVDGRLTGCCDSVIMPSYEAAINLSLCPPQQEVAVPVLPVLDSVSTVVPTVTKQLAVTEQLAITEKFIAPMDDYAADKQAGMYHRNRDALRVYFRQAHSRIDTAYRDNASVLHRFANALRVMQADREVRVTRILIVGYASIEGSVETNDRLAERRARVLKDFAVERGIAPDCVEAINMGESWDELRDLVAESEVEARAEVLRIIDTVPLNKGREKQLMDLRGGRPYRWMMKHLFPLLRNAGYVKVYYEKTK